MPEDDRKRRAVSNRLGSERRSVVRGTAAGIGATLGVAGSASGVPSGTLEPVAAADHISAPTADAPGVRESPREAVNFLDRSGSVFGMSSMTEASGGVSVTATVVEDRVTPQVYVMVPVEAGTLMVSVLPEEETGVADLVTEDGSMRLVSSPIQFSTECGPYGDLCYRRENPDRSV